MVETKSNVGIVELIISFLIPLVGIILFAIRKDNVDNPLSYLVSATFGFAACVIILLLLGAL